MMKMRDLYIERTEAATVQPPTLLSVHSVMKSSTILVHSLRLEDI